MKMDDFKYLNNSFEFVSLEERQKEIKAMNEKISIELKPGDVVKIKGSHSYYIIDSLNYVTENLGVFDYSLHELFFINGQYYPSNTLFLANKLDIEKVLSQQEKTSISIVK